MPPFHLRCLSSYWRENVYLCTQGFSKACKVCIDHGDPGWCFALEGRFCSACVVDDQEFVDFSLPAMCRGPEHSSLTQEGTHCSLTRLYNWTIREGKVTWTHLPQSNKGFWCIGPYSWHLHPHSILVPQHRRKPLEVFSSMDYWLYCALRSQLNSLIPSYQRVHDILD